MSARLSAGMMPYFIPPPPPGASHSSRGAGGSGHQRSYSDDTTNNTDSVLDLMTPPMSPTEHAFDFAATINSRFDAATTLSSSSSSSLAPAHHQYHQHHQPSAFSLDEQEHSSRTDKTSRKDRTYSSNLLGTSSPASTGFSSVVSPRPVSFHWDDYQSLDEGQDDSSDQDDFDYKTRYRHHRPPRQEKKYQETYRDYESEGDEDDYDDQEVLGGAGTEYDDEDSMRRAYQRQFEGHHSLVRRRSSFGGRRGSGGHGGDSYSEDSKYDSVRHGIGQSVSDVSEELTKARMAMNRASQAMRSMEAELKAMQLSIGKTKGTVSLSRMCCGHAHPEPY